MRGFSSLSLFCIYLLSFQADFVLSQIQGSQECEVTSADGTTINYNVCYPDPVIVSIKGNSNFNATISPEDATCGATRTEYCTLYVNPDTDKRCGIFCDASSDTEKHPPEYMYSVTSFQANTEQWWQSVSWNNYPEPLEINITFSWDHEYELADDLTFQFKTSRPQKAILEKSVDYGATWQIWQYYMTDCQDLINLGLVGTISAQSPTTITCTTAYSNVIPYIDGTLDFNINTERLSLFMGPNGNDFTNLYTAKVNTGLDGFLSFTNIRLRLLVPGSMVSAGVLSTGDLDREKLSSYYAIKNTNMVATCSCNLHARQCKTDETTGETVCLCRHNTMGKNCEKCQALYNDRPWKAGSYAPAPSGIANECKKCECYDHADSCFYDVNLGHGQCENCYHNTTGDHCEQCIPMYFRNMSLPLNSPDLCIPCDCESLGILDNDMTCTEPNGQCRCKPTVKGRKCNECVDQYYGLLLDSEPGVCKPCNCQTDGTVALSNICDQTTGNCQCKDTIIGDKCDQCRDGYYGYPRGRPANNCTKCECDLGGSVSTICNKETGKCSCKPGMNGFNCDQTAQGTFAAAFDHYVYQPVTGTCGKSTALQSDSEPFTGRVFMLCVQNQEVVFELVNDIKTGSITYVFTPVLRYSLDGMAPWESLVLKIAVKGNSNIDVIPYAEALGESLLGTCQTAVGVEETFNIANLTAGTGLAWSSSKNMTMDVRCMYEIKLLVSTPGQAAGSRLLIDSVILAPDYLQSNAYLSSDMNTQLQHKSCFYNYMNLYMIAAALQNTQCTSFMKSVGSEMQGGGVDCMCNQIGTMDSINMQCNPIGGQCACKPGVFGRKCDICVPGYYNFTSTGCTNCDCQALGSTGLVCDENSGQCPCKQNVAVGGENGTFGTPADKRCSSCKADHFGYSTNNGCQLCLCNPTGSSIPQCDDTGTCECIPTVGGAKCDQCLPEFFKFAAGGCTSCNCSMDGSTSPICNADTGQCPCKGNVDGIQCSQCKGNSFNLNSIHPEGCQRCFCYGHGTACGSAQGFTSNVITYMSVNNWTLATDIGGLGDVYLYTHGIMMESSNYKQAPQWFLGDHHNAYGNLLTMDMYTNVPMEISLDEARAVLIVGNGKAMWFYMGNTTIDMARKTLELRLLENLWRTNTTSNSGPDYFTFYSILADIQGFYIRTAYSGFPVFVENIRFEDAKPITDPAVEVPVTYVENCTCTVARNTGGYSCENCAQGYLRNNQIISNYETCVACDCNDRTETNPAVCDENTGQCMNCRPGTTGFRCESCEPHVTGTECDTCESGFFGIQRGGCQPCACDPVGSKPGTVCNGDADGQCDCQPNVAGRQCNECADNYENLQATGCTVCDDCYALVTTEVDTLRSMETNLTSYVENLTSMDNNTRLGPFHERLDETQKLMQTLLAFLDESIKVEASVRQQIAHLNNTLKHLNEIIDVDVTSSLFNATNNLNSTRFKVEASEEMLLITKENVVRAQLFLQSTISGPGGLSTQIADLVSQIQALETQVSSVSNGALTDATKIMNQVKKIETDSQLALDTATNSVKVGQEAEALLLDTIKRITDLKDFIVTLNNLRNTLVNDSTALLTNVTQLLTTTEAILGEASTLTNTGIDAQPLIQAASSIITLSNNLADRANSSFYSNQIIVSQVQGVKIAVADFNTRLEALKTKASALTTRMDTAHQQATAASTQEKKVFEDAANMLDIMGNFDMRIAIASGRANTSLVQINNLKTTGQQVVTDAQQLQQQLITAQAAAQQAVDVSQKTLTDITAEQQKAAPIYDKAMQLQVETDAMLVQEQVQGTLDNLVDSQNVQINPADMTCQGLESQIVAVNERADKAVQESKTASETVVGTSNKLDQIRSDIANIDHLDPNRVPVLLNEVENTREKFNELQLAQMIAELKAASERQRNTINELKARRDTMRSDLRRLRDVANQFLP